MDTFTCNCGGAVPTPEAPLSQGEPKGDALCPECKQLWEFRFSPRGVRLNAPPTPVGPPASP